MGAGLSAWGTAWAALWSGTWGPEQEAAADAGLIGARLRKRGGGGVRFIPNPPPVKESAVDDDEELVTISKAFFNKVLTQ